MPSLKGSRSGFTLIEVMVAVMIVSIVIAALLQMQGNTNYKFMQIKDMMHSNQYNSFLLTQGPTFGFEDSSTDMKSLVETFDLESDLRRELSSMKVKLSYEELSTFDTNDFIGGDETNSSDSSVEDEEEQTSSSGLIFEIGKTILKTEYFDGQLIRVRLQ